MWATYDTGVSKGLSVILIILIILMGTGRVAREHGLWPHGYAMHAEWAVSSSK
jgi:hypothetical protein